MIYSGRRQFAALTSFLRSDKQLTPMRLTPARAIALLCVLVCPHGLVGATNGVVDPRVSLRQADSEPSIDAIVDREASPTFPVADEQAVTPEQLAQQEQVRRQEFVFTANKAIFDGDRLKAAGEYESAAKRYEFALAHLSPGGQMANLYQRAATSLASIKAAWGDLAMKKGNYEEAAHLYTEASSLDPTREGYQSDLAHARRKLQETTGQTLPPPSHEQPHSQPSIMPATRTRTETPDDNFTPQLNTPPATTTTHNHIADPSDMLN
jgi:hypothetical protein